MPQSLITGLRSVELGVHDVAAHEKFYTQAWQLKVAARAGTPGSASEIVYLRATGANHHVLSLTPRPKTEVLAVTLRAGSVANLATLAAQVAASGGSLESGPAPAADPAGGTAIAFRDPQGRRFCVVAGDKMHADTQSAPDQAERLAHVVLNSTDVDTVSNFLVATLGFTVSDRTRHMNFLRCGNGDHHNIAFAHGAANTLNHIAFNMPSLEAVMLGAGRVRDCGYPIEWGVGRHGPGHNVFAYFVAPGDVAVEFTGEVEQVDDSYKPGGPEDWKWPPGRVDHWGVSPPPSPRLKEAQTRISFSE
jgi:catechol 2,3-dioxygenase